ncbi:hypothetical protein V5799_030834 [Amblyomma americanum]|uniref:Legumain-like protease n=1 Tax=Amblyomma americanum TaxID=6943 RepID=A0AAQ4EMZ6_AMBAM
MAVSRPRFLPLLAVTLSVFAFPAKSGVMQNISRPPTRIWAFLVAGSNTYDNYRHQADICHAYHVLHNHGVPDQRIVVMMYDDIANNTENKTPGVILNHPKGSDVYKGVPKDYTEYMRTS